MRARSLKPSIFKNELLAVADPLYTLVFEGLWCAADREGRLEDRPGKLHIEINPGRAFEGTERSLAWLAEHEFIVRYSVQGQQCIAIPTFLKHQRPHQNEKPSTLPPPPSTTKATSEPGSNEGEAQPRHEATCDQSNKHFALTPDSGLLTPDSGLLTADTPRLAPRSARCGPRATDVLRPEPAWFVAFRQAYPELSGDPGWALALEAGSARIREGAKAEDLVAGAQRYAAYVTARGDHGTRFVKAPRNFLGPEKLFLLPWAPPRSGGDGKPRRKILTADEIEAMERERASL